MIEVEPDVITGPSGPMGLCGPFDVDFDTFDDREIPPWPGPPTPEFGDWGNASSGPAWIAGTSTSDSWVEGGWGIMQAPTWVDFPQFTAPYFKILDGPFMGATDFSMLMRVKWTTNWAYPFAGEVGLWVQVAGTRVGIGGITDLEDMYVEDRYDHSGGGGEVPILDDVVYLFRWDYTPNADGHSRSKFWPESEPEPSTYYETRTTWPGSDISTTQFALGIWCRFGSVGIGPKLSVDWIRFSEPCTCCFPLLGASGLVDPGSAIPGPHTVIQSSASALTDIFDRSIPWVWGPLAPGPNGAWYQFGVADTGQQWWSNNNGGAQAPPPPNSIELDGTSVLFTGWHGGGAGAYGQINLPADGGFAYEFYDFGWNLASHGFDALLDIYFEQYGVTIIDTAQWTMSVASTSESAVQSPPEIVYRIGRASDPTTLFMLSGGLGGISVSLPTLAAATWYRIHWQIDGNLCTSRARIWPRDSPEPTTWDGTIPVRSPLRPNATFGISESWQGGFLPHYSRMTNLSLIPASSSCYATVCEDAVTQLGPRQFQLRNSYLPTTITAFVDHAGPPLVTISRYQTVPNIIEDNPAAGIFSFPAPIHYAGGYNPGIDLGTVITACYIVPPAAPIGGDVTLGETVAIYGQ